MFIGYALVLAALTHWPRLKLPGPELRTDLVVHLVAFGLWMLLFARAGFFGARTSGRTIALSVLAAIVYAAVDELTQGFPALGRTVALSDWLANVLGIVLVGAVLEVLRRRKAGSPPHQS